MSCISAPFCTKAPILPDVPQKEGLAALEMGHFKWEGPNRRMLARRRVHGKNDLLNNFCIAIPSNEGRCTQCHAGIGYADDTFDFEDPANVDCLICHDQSGTYSKAPTTAGAPPSTVDLNAVARSIALGSDPSVKTASTAMRKQAAVTTSNTATSPLTSLPPRVNIDVHMGTDGANLKCTACHGANHNPERWQLQSRQRRHVAALRLRRRNETVRGLPRSQDRSTPIRLLTDCLKMAGTNAWPARSAISRPFARKFPPRVEWYWADAGQDKEPPIDPATGRPTYDKKKGTFVWKNNVRPVLRYSNGDWDRMVINKPIAIREEPIQLATPHGDYNDPNAMIYPFKKMIGNQPVDTVNKTVMVPHLFGGKGGPNPYWAKYDWNLALQDGSAYTGQPYSGTYGFADTEMLLSVNHEVAPAENALGSGPLPDACMDCHSTEYIEWDKLGWTDDPLNGGDRVDAPTLGQPCQAHASTKP